MDVGPLLFWEWAGCLSAQHGRGAAITHHVLHLGSDWIHTLRGGLVDLG